MQTTYEMVIGLEVHVELSTKSKIFCGCSTEFAAQPNANCCPVCAGMPGTLPVLNEKVVEYAIQAGLATHCEIARYSKNDRKNYFYPDLPKAYQISQYDLPLCFDGYLDISTSQREKRVGITRIHIEEDAGKLIHDEKLGTLLDLNRCGVPLIEIVSEPDMRSGEEAVTYLKMLHSIVKYTGISDAKMNEGSFRCDVNLSIRPAGSEELGTRTEIKNLNSFQFVAKAIESEYKRQVKVVSEGGIILQQTMRFDPVRGETSPMRTKEDADDYRYFPDPDLMPIQISEQQITELQAALPLLPEQRKMEYQEKYGLSAYHSELLVLDKTLSDFFEETLVCGGSPTIMSTFLIGEISRLRGEQEEKEFCITAQQLSEIGALLEQQKIHSGGAKRLITTLWEEGGTVEAIVEKLDLLQITDISKLSKLAQQAVAENPKIVADYRGGKKSALKSLMGKAMALSAGKGNPEQLRTMLQEMLDKE